jgi:hypothetical protein
MFLLHRVRLEKRPDSDMLKSGSLLDARVIVAAELQFKVFVLG